MAPMIVGELIIVSDGLWSQMHVVKKSVSLVGRAAGSAHLKQNENFGRRKIEI